jgi:hypothetical protein
MKYFTTACGVIIIFIAFISSLLTWLFWVSPWIRKNGQEPARRTIAGGFAYYMDIGKALRIVREQRSFPAMLKLHFALEVTVLIGVILLVVSGIITP